MGDTPGSWQAFAEAVLLPVAALAAALLCFGVFVWFGGHSPLQAWTLLFRGAFGDSFSWQNTLLRAAPLMLTGLAVALPARAGLIVIGGEGALPLRALRRPAPPVLGPFPRGPPGRPPGLATAAALAAPRGALG